MSSGPLRWKVHHEVTKDTKVDLPRTAKQSYASPTDSCPHRKMIDEPHVQRKMTCLPPPVGRSRVAARRSGSRRGTGRSYAKMEIERSTPCPAGRSAGRSTAKARRTRRWSSHGQQNKLYARRCSAARTRADDRAGPFRVKSDPRCQRPPNGGTRKAQEPRRSFPIGRGWNNV
jgi:hypothetical protein